MHGARLTHALRLALALLAAGCSEAGAPVPARPLVAVSVPPQACFVERIAGDRVELLVMVPPGASQETHEPTLAELRALERASLYVKVGHPRFPFEQAWLAPLLAERPDLPVVDGSQGIAAVGDDPHLWLAPSHVRVMARGIHAALVQLFPGDEAALDANLRAFLAEVDAVDAEVRERLRGREGSRFLVFHPAWGHLAAEYGLEQIAIEHEGKDPDPRRVATLIAQARRDGIRTVFVQPQFDPSSAELVAREIGARIEPLDPLVRDWPSNLRHVAQRLAEGLAT